MNDAMTNRQAPTSPAACFKPMHQQQDDLLRRQRQAQEALAQQPWSQAQAQQLQLSRNCLSIADTMPR